MAAPTTSEAGSSKTARTSKRQDNLPRKRVSQACDRCRARKDKCDGLKPVCSTCTAQEAICNYDSNTKKRGLPEGYVRGLEKLWGLSIREVDEIEQSVLTALSNESIAETWTDSANDVETLQETWRNSRLAKELVRVLPLLESEEKSGKRKRDPSRAESLSCHRPASKASPTSQDRIRTPQVHTTTSSLDVNANSNIDPIFRSAPSHGLDNGPDSTHQFESTRDGGKILGPVGDVDQIPQLPTRTFDLVDIYFSYTHSWFPILEKYDIVRFSHQYATAVKDAAPASSALKPSASGNNAVLWALIAYSDRQRQAIQGGSLQEPSPDKLYEYARSLIPREDDCLDIGHVQALLILTLYCMGCDRWKAAWSLIGQASRLAIELGFGRPGKNKSKRSHHVFLGSFVLDTLIAARLKRRPQMRREDIEGIRVEEDGLEEWDPQPDCLHLHKQVSRTPAGVLSTFNGLVNVLAVLNDVVCNTSSLACDYQSLLMEMDAIIQLPPQFAPTWTPRKEETQQPMLPHHYHLFTAYVTTSTALYMHAKHISPFPIQQVAASTLRQIAKLLKQHSQHFGLLIVPPTYDYYTLVAAECTVIDQNPLDDYRIDIQHSLFTMVTTWPTYTTISRMFKFQESGSNEAPPHLQSYQQLPLTHLGPSSIRPQLPRIMSEMQRSDQQAMYIPANLGQHRSPSMSGFNVGDQDMLNSFGKSPIPAVPASHHFQPTTHAEYTPQPGLALTSWPTPTSSTLRDPFALGPRTQQAASNTFDTAGTTSPLLEIDGDSMFNEFATLDAMEWTQNWDQSLFNLGFTDPTSMNRDFYTFCREAEPFRTTGGLVQQLLSSHLGINGFNGAVPGSGGHTTPLMDSERGRDGSVGGVGQHQQQPRVDQAGHATQLGSDTHREYADQVMIMNSHVEASQILQRLASGNIGSGGVDKGA